MPICKKLKSSIERNYLDKALNSDEDSYDNALDEFVKFLDN